MAGPEEQGEDDAEIAGVAADAAFDGLDAVEKFGQIEPFDKAPDEAGGMIGIQALVEGFGAILALQAFGPVDARGGLGRRVAGQGRCISARWQGRLQFGGGKQHGLAGTVASNTGWELPSTAGSVTDTGWG